MNARVLLPLSRRISRWHQAAIPASGFQHLFRGQAKGIKKAHSVSQVIECSSFWQMLATFPKRRPFLTNLGISAVTSGAGDLSAQKAEGSSEVDWRRFLLFTAWGTTTFGVISWFVYVTVFSRICPHAIRFSSLSWGQKMRDYQGQRDLAKQVFLDLAVYVPFVFYPFMYVFKTWFANPEAEPKAAVVQGLAAYQPNFWQDNAMAWVFWIPGDVLVFAVPVWLRMPTNHFLCYLWSAVLSFMRGFKE